MTAITLTLPTYLKNPDQENYNQELNQSLQYYLSPNGFPVPQITNANLLLIAPNLPDGMLWFVVDHVPPVYVGKISGALVQFTTTAYP